MTNNSRAGSYLGLAKKGGNLVCGDEMVRAAVRAGHARLVVLAADAGDHTKRRAENLSASWHAPVYWSEWSKQELGQAVGGRACAFVAFTEPRLALAFLQALDPPAPQTLLDEVGKKAQRAQARQDEERAHEKNVKHGAAPQRKRTK